ncbi:MAG: adenylosuccinate synthase [Clostridia bacterium]|nr:adenylosuccinate synthase [Clostridia bacterium]
MSTVVLIGAQWGDEGKGKITDFLAEKADVVVRYQGGNNAGHTVVVGETEYKLHLIPSGILYPRTICVIGNGVVVDPEVLLRELAYLKERGIDTTGLRISSNAHVIMPYHKMLDELEEERRGKNKIGTTKRGIGPCYMDKYARAGIRIADLLEKDELAEKLEVVLEQKNHLLEKVYGVKGLDFEEVLAAFCGYGQQIKDFVTDTSLLINDFYNSGKNVLFEGAQGTLLDLDHGTYPYVTSSHPIAGGACIGAGIGPTRINKVLGVVKAYTTRVGEGPFPTELQDELGEAIRKAGWEFGTTTGRPRRCGWFDVVMFKYSVRISGIDHVALTKLDVLDQLETIKVCVGYNHRGQVITSFPTSLKALAECEPVYEELPGWLEDTSRARSVSDLPENAQKYIKRIEELTGVKAAIIAVGPKREQTIVVERLF